MRQAHGDCNAGMTVLEDGDSGSGGWWGKHTDKKKSTGREKEALGCKDSGFGMGNDVRHWEGCNTGMPVGKGEGEWWEEEAGEEENQIFLGKGRLGWGEKFFLIDWAPGDILGTSVGNENDFHG